MPIIKDIPLPAYTPYPVRQKRLDRQKARTNRTVNSLGIVVNMGDSIQQAIDDVFVNGGGTVNLVSGTYMVNYDINLKSNVYITGNGASVVDFQNQAFGFKITGSDSYKTGTVSINLLGTVVTGTGTVFTQAMVGQSILLEEFWYEIASVASEASLTLASTYLGATLTTAYYVIATTINNVILKNFTVQNSSVAAIKVQYSNLLLTDGLGILYSAIGIDGDDSSVTTILNNGITGCITAMTWDYFQFGGYINCNITESGPWTINNSRNWGMEVFSISNGTGNGITCTNLFNSAFTDFTIQHCEGKAIEFVAGCKYTQTATGGVLYNGSDGIKFTASSVNNSIIGCAFIENTGYGINIADSTNNDNIVYPNTYNGNTLGKINDSGTRTIAGSDTNIRAKAYKDNTQAIPTGVVTLVELNAEDYDSGNNFDSVTNFRYTAPVSGYYLVVGQVTLTSNADQRIVGYIYKNGTLFLENANSPAVATNNASIIPNIVYLLASDYLDLRIFQDAGVSKNTVASSSATFLTVHLLSI